MQLNRDSVQTLLAVASLAAMATLMFLTSPTNGNFWWSDAPRHALNGAFLLDLFRELPFDDPRGWALDYYRQYPALTILFYPPLFHVVEAGFFALFGVSHATAQLVVASFYLLAGMGAWLVARRWLAPGPALATTLLFLALPEITYWGRQVMLDVPMTALCLWTAHFLLRYREQPSARYLYLLSMMFVTALWCKQTAVFMLIPILVGVLQTQGRAFFFNATTWKAAGLFLVVVAPLVVITWHFGRFNIISIVTGDSSTVSRDAFPETVYYLRTMPIQMGWPATVVFVLSLGALALRADLHRPQGSLYVMLAWLLGGMVFFTLISLKSTRFAVPFLFPAVLITGYVMSRLLNRYLATTALLLLAGSTLAISLFARPVPLISGYREAADFVAETAPADSKVLFSGYNDGGFIFGLRARGDRPDLSVLRSDKVFFRMAVHPDYGIGEVLGYDETAIRDLLNAEDVAMVVVEPGFLPERPAIRRLQRILDAGSYKQIRRIQVHSTRIDKRPDELIVYRRTSDDNIGRDKAVAPLYLPIIDTVIAQ